MNATASDSGCPTWEQLRQLLEGSLDLGAQGLIETHVESCDSCQASLRTLSDGSQTAEWRQVVQGAGDAETAAYEFLGRVKQSPPAGDLVIEFPLPPTPDAPLGRLGSYAILKELGRGGMGVVFLARDAQLRHLVALKVLKPDLAAVSNERERFCREGRAVAAVKNDHVVAIHSAFAPESFAPYLVMEYVEGEPLDVLLSRGGPLPPLECARLVQQAAMGLAAAHKNHIVHRDVKPSNMMLESATGRLKITDFGLARRPEGDDENLTRLGNIVGTPAYMSPEHVLQPEGVNQASDIYSLGVVLYELMTGEKPFTGRAHMVLNQIVHEEPRLPRRLNDAIPRDLETICLKAMRKAPSDRYADAGALADDLSRLLRGEPIHARPVSRREKLWMWCRRNPWIAFPTAASVLLVLVAFGVVAWSNVALASRYEELQKQTVIANEQRGIAEEHRGIAEKERDLAEDRADIAIQMGQTLYAVTKNEIGRTPGLASLKQSLLRAAMKGIEALPQMKGKSGITTAASLLKYNLLMHELYLEIGETDKAWTHIVSAHDIARERINLQVNPNAERLNLADVCRDMANIRRQSHRDMRMALTNAQEAAAHYLDVLDHPRPSLGARMRVELTESLSGTYSRMAALYVRLGEPAQALAYFEKTRSLLDDFPSTPGFSQFPPAAQKQIAALFREKSVPAIAGIGEMQFRLGQIETARQNYAQAVELREATYAQHPDNPLAKQFLVGMLSQAGNLDMLTGESEKAAAKFDRAIELGRELVAADPKIVPYQTWLALAYFRRGILRQMQNDAAAKESFDACLKLRTALASDATNVDRQRELLLVLPHCGQYREADALADKLLAANAEPDVELLLDLARAYAQCSLAAESDATAADAFRAKALDRLKQAVAGGHRDPVYLEHEPDFAPLRSTSEFPAHIEQERKSVVPAEKAGHSGP